VLVSNDLLTHVEVGYMACGLTGSRTFRPRRFRDGTFRRWCSQIFIRKKCVFEILQMLDCKGCMLDKRFCWHPEVGCGFSSAGSLEEFRATVTMCGRKYGL